MAGGAKKSAPKKAKKSKSSSGDKPKRKLHPSLVEFAKLRKFIAEKTGKDGKPAMQIASKVKKDAQQKDPNGTMASWVEAGKKLYVANPNKYKL